MNKLSFRAWDVKKQVMLYVDSLSGVGDLFRMLTDEPHQNYKAIYNTFTDVNYKWMQCTNCQDKNGKMIFDGDIVKCDIPLRNVFYPEYVGVVSIDLHISGKINIRNENELVSDRDFIELLLNLEVIGNIYENQDLL